jgi:hypothetical protein
MGLGKEGLQSIGIQKSMDGAKTTELTFKGNLLRGRSRKVCFSLMLESTRNRKKSYE